MIGTSQVLFVVFMCKTFRDLRLPSYVPEEPRKPPLDPPPPSRTALYRRKTVRKDIEKRHKACKTLFYYERGCEGNAMFRLKMFEVFLRSDI